MEFGPDGAFGFDILNEKKAHQFLKDNQLESISLAIRYQNSEWVPGTK